MGRLFARSTPPIMQLCPMKLLFLLQFHLSSVAAVSGNRHLRAASGSASATGEEYTLMQFSSKFCKSETYVCLSLTEGQFTRKHLPDGRSPEILCDKLTKEDEDGYFSIDSCPGTDADGCPVDKCKNCTEDAVKHFVLDQCDGGYMLKKGQPDGFNCVSVDNVDVGLARWCDRWPTSSSDIKVQHAQIVGSVALKVNDGEGSSELDEEDKGKVNEAVGISCTNLTVGLTGGSAYKKMKSAMGKYKEAAKGL
eukprot:gnl/MRDRNA2_/MRDRNA2_92646_c0_seq1.p1 gnl/MRDRNA2_/MRDRNA2_92646_c0~~gnl/MRDRNA2_/MRDRNA2_92646_c0_seq1.p1  ORF type:complete len:251 (-),score=47.33 gnl/MRDRNA2_/MRDRNA2_92646_c0_seq1:79-831(-)